MKPKKRKRSLRPVNIPKKLKDLSYVESLPTFQWNSCLFRPVVRICYFKQRKKELLYRYIICKGENGKLAKLPWKDSSNTDRTKGLPELRLYDYKRKR